MSYRDLASAADLNGPWRLAFEPTEGGVLADARSVAEIESSGAPVYDATVPGNLELDLQANGLIGEPFHGMNIAGLTRLETMRVVYWRTFQAPDRPGFRPILEAQGVDCYATIVLNGQVIGRCDNMLVEHRFELQPEDLRAENEIIVIIEPPLRPTAEADYPPSAARHGRQLRIAPDAQGSPHVRLGHHAASPLGGHMAARAHRVCARRAH